MSPSKSEPEVSGKVRCIDCGEEFFPIEMDAGDPDRKGFCQGCADAAREYERTLI